MTMTKEKKTPTGLMRALRMPHDLDVSPERFRALSEIANGLRPFAAMNKESFLVCSLIFSDAVEMARDDKIGIEEIWSKTRQAVSVRIVDGLLSQTE